MLRYYEDLTEADTARALGISVVAVKSHAREALERLRKPVPEPGILGRRPGPPLSHADQPAEQPLSGDVVRELGVPLHAQDVPGTGPGPLDRLGDAIVGARVTRQHGPGSSTDWWWSEVVTAS